MDVFWRILPTQLIWITSQPNEVWLIAWCLWILDSRFHLTTSYLPWTIHEPSMNHPWTRHCNSYSIQLHHLGDSPRWEGLAHLDLLWDILSIHSSRKTIVDLPAYNSTYLIQVYNLRLRRIWVYNGQSSPHTWRLFRLHSASPVGISWPIRPEGSIAQRQVKMVAKRVLVCAWPLGMPLLWSLCNVKANMLQAANTK